MPAHRLLADRIDGFARIFGDGNPDLAGQLRRETPLLSQGQHLILIPTAGTVAAHGCI